MNYKNLPKKRMAAGCLFLNDKKELLILKPSYRETWNIPGGVIEENESPLAACKREIKEELGIECKINNLFVISSVPMLIE